MRSFFALSIALIGWGLVAQVYASEASYDIDYSTSITTSLLQDICDEQIKDSRNLLGAAKTRAGRFTYCSSPLRSVWVQKFIHHLENDDGFVSNATAILLSDSLMIDTIISGKNALRITDSGWFVLGAYETAREQNSPATIVGIIEKRSEKDPRQRYRFFELSLRSNFAGENEIYVRTTLIPITSSDIAPFKKWRYFHGASFREYVVTSFREDSMKDSWRKAFGTFTNAE